MQIQPFEKSHVEKVLLFADRFIGQDYFTTAELDLTVENSVDPKAKTNCSFVLIDENENLKGFRLTLPPGNWSHKTTALQGLSQSLWKVPLEKTAYFQTVLVDPELRGQGFAVRLSTKSFEALKKTDAEAVVCHSWKESPGQSSRLYLESLGFQAIKEYPHFWTDIDYSCILCGNPCGCTAVEMIKYLYK